MPRLGLLSPADRWYSQRNARSLLSTIVTAHIPTSVECTAPGCGYDAFTHSGKNPSCTVCGGTGLVTTWFQAYLRAFVTWVGPSQPVYMSGMGGVDVGDLVIVGMLRNRRIYESVRDTDGAYILVDDKHVKPVSVTKTSVEGITAVSVTCNVIRE